MSRPSHPMYGKHPISAGQFWTLLIKRSKWWEDPLAVSLQVVRFDHSPHYSTLSYAWGTQAPDAILDVDGHRFRISETVSNALHTLRASSVFDV